MLEEFRELQGHQDLRDELLDRTIQEALDDPDPGIPAKEVNAEMKHMLAEPRPNERHLRVCWHDKPGEERRPVASC